MKNRTFNDFREDRGIDPAHIPGAIAKSAFSRIGESADGKAVRDFLQGVVNSQSVSYLHEDLIGHEARRRFASEMLQLMETKHAKRKQPKPT